MEERVEVAPELLEKYPDLFALEVVGACCEPDIHEGQIVALSNMEPPAPGRFFAANTGRELPTLGRVNRVVEGEFILGEWKQGGVRYATMGEVLGVVVAVL